MPPLVPLASPDEVGQYLGLTTQQLAQMRYEGKGPRFLKPTGRQIRYRWEDVEAWLASRSYTQTGQAAATV